VAIALCALGAGVLVAVLTGGVGASSVSSRAGAVDPPAVLADAATPTAARPSQAALFSGRGTAAGPWAGRRRRGHAGRTGRAGSQGPGVASAGAVVAQAPAGPSASEGESLIGVPEVPISAAWESGFYPIYGEAQRVFGVNWLLLASIHRQETAFSTAPTTYHGLNFAGCCGGPMQFNVTNGPVSTWDLVRRAYRFGARPAVYDHRTARHPSIYDDFDSVMAAAWLLYSDGAGTALDDSAWWAAYDYYGHDATGVEYADEVLARAIGWSQHGFCVDCGVQPGMVKAVYEAWGAPVAGLFQDCASNSQATWSEASAVPPQSRRESCARRK
jgi:hypothetical protein